MRSFIFAALLTLGEAIVSLAERFAPVEAEVADESSPVEQSYDPLARLMWERIVAQQAVLNNAPARPLFTTWPSFPVADTDTFGRRWDDELPMHPVVLGGALEHEDRKP